MDNDDNKVTGSSNSNGNNNSNELKPDNNLNPNNPLNPDETKNINLNDADHLNTDERFIGQGTGINPSNPLYQLQFFSKEKDTKSNSGGSSSELSNANKYLLAGDVISKTDELKTATQSLQVNELEKIYFDRKLKPLVDTLWELSTSAQNFAGMSNLYQANNYGKKRDVKQSLDLSLKILDQCEELWDLVKLRLKFFENNMDPYE